MAVSIVGSDLPVGRRTRVPFGLHGGEGDVVRLRETIVRTLRKSTRCGEARGIKADSHTRARAHVFVCVMMQNRRKRINGVNAGITQSQRRSKLNRECLRM